MPIKSSSYFLLHKAVAAVLFVALIATAVNYFFRLSMLGLVDGNAKGTMLSVLGLAIVYGIFFSPTRQEMDQHRESKRMTRSK